jgi:hypothetical protein
MVRNEIQLSATYNYYDYKMHECWANPIKLLPGEFITISTESEGDWDDRHESVSYFGKTK